MVDSLIELLDAVLNNLTVESLDLRINASLALCGLAIAKLKSEGGSSYPRSRATSIICQYIDRETKRSKLWDPTKCLPNILKTALTNENSWDTYGPSFGLAVVSSFLVLIDRFIWETPRALKLLVNTIALFAGHKRSNIRYLHPELWRMMVWAFSRLPTGSLPPNSQENSGPEGLHTIREKAFSFLFQERKNGLLADVVCNLLCPGTGEPRSDADVTKALGVVRDLLSSGDLTSKNDGVRLLVRMLVNIGRPSPDRSEVKEGFTPKERFSWALVDGSFAKRKAKEIRVQPFRFDIEGVSPLSEQEVVCHWDELSYCWIMTVQRCLEDGRDLSVSLHQCEKER